MQEKEGSAEGSSGLLAWGSVYMGGRVLEPSFTKRVQEVPRGFRMAPRGFQDVSKRAQESSKMTQDGSKRYSEAIGEV